MSLSLLNPPHFSFAMDFHVYGISRLIFMSSILVFFVGICLALLENPNLRSSSLANNSGQINSNSVLIALMDSHYTELVELVEKALLLQTLEETIGKHNITIFAPRNEALERDLDLESFTFKLFSWFESESFLATKIYWFFFFYIISGFVFLDLGLCSCCSCSRHI